MRAVFFFSSRRRHTRLTCDWSSDVCSSDLPSRATAILRSSVSESAAFLIKVATQDSDTELRKMAVARLGEIAGEQALGTRSEERRVGKECRSRWTAAPLKTKLLSPAASGVR